MRLDFEPLLTHVEHRVGKPATWRPWTIRSNDSRGARSHRSAGFDPRYEGTESTNLSAEVIAGLLNVSRRQVDRWKVEGLTVRSAERACESLGIHPVELWGDDYYADLLVKVS